LSAVAISAASSGNAAPSNAFRNPAFVMTGLARAITRRATINLCVARLVRFLNCYGQPVVLLPVGLVVPVPSVPAGQLAGVEVVGLMPVCPPVDGGIVLGIVLGVMPGVVVVGPVPVFLAVPGTPVVPGAVPVALVPVPAALPDVPAALPLCAKASDATPSAVTATRAIFNTRMICSLLFSGLPASKERDSARSVPAARPMMRNARYSVFSAGRSVHVRATANCLAASSCLPA
jgi:hypothetical protein